MAWRSSTAVIGTGSNGVLSTTSNNALIEGDWSNDYLEIYGASDTVLGNDGTDSIGAMMYPALGMYGTNVSIEGGNDDDMLVAAAIQGEQYATLYGGAGIDSYVIGCNSDSTLNVVFEDFNILTEEISLFYEGYSDKKFTCYTSDKKIIIYDDERRLNVTISGADLTDVDVDDIQIWIYPHAVRRESAKAVVSTVWYNGDNKDFKEVMNYGGYISGITITDNSIVVDDFHSGGVITNDIYGLENIIVIDNIQSREGRFLGGNAQANYIFAGSGGDTLWGGANNDVLVAGAGNDNFIYNAGEGVDFMLNTNWLDTVTLNGLTLNNIAVATEDGAIAIASDENNSVVIQYEGIYSPLIKLGDGSTWRYKGDDSTWQNF